MALRDYRPEDEYIPGDPLAPNPTLFPGVRDVRGQSASAQPQQQGATRVVAMPEATIGPPGTVSMPEATIGPPGTVSMPEAIIGPPGTVSMPETDITAGPMPVEMPETTIGPQATSSLSPPPLLAAPAPAAVDPAGFQRQSYAQYGKVPMQNLTPVQAEGREPEPYDPRQQVMLRYTAPGVYVTPDGIFAESTQAKAPSSSIEGFGQTMQITGRPTEAPRVDLNSYTADLAAQIPMVGAAQVRLDPGVAAGVKYQQDALRNLQKLYGGEEKNISDLEQDYNTASQQYQLGLQKLSERRGGMDRARNVERGIEAANQAAAEMRFDANRVYSQLAQSPLETGALAIAAGIVQGLQGYAGQDKPNVVLDAVQQAAQRDLANQVEQYKRMQAGQSYTRNAFIEARQQLQDDQQALQVAAMARLDQISKGFSFIRERLVRAKDRADMDVTIGKLDTAVAEERTKLAVQNADRQLHANIANQSTMQHIFQASAKAMADMQKMTAAQRMKSEQHIADFSRTDEGKGVRESIDSATAFYTAINNLVEKGATPKDLRAVIEQDTLTTLRKALLSAKNETGTKGAVYEAFNRTLAEGIAKGSFSPEKREMQQLIAQVFTSYARAQLGKSQTSTELVKALEAFDPQNADSVYRFIGRMVSDADSMVRQQINIMPSSAPAWYNAYGKQIDIAKTINNNIVNAFQNLQGLQQPDRQGR